MKDQAPSSAMYEHTDQKIKIVVCPVFLEDHSTPEENRFVWAYYVRIENLGEDPVQLRARHWKIVDSTGHTHEVDGEGVIGQQPVIAPGHGIEYASSAPLPTPSGMMSGHYTMRKLPQAEDEDITADFTVNIPAFSLDSPFQSRTIH